MVDTSRICSDQVMTVWRVETDGCGRFCVADYGDRSGGVTTLPCGRPLVGLSLKAAVALATRMAAEDGGFLEIDFDGLARGDA